MYSVNKNRSPCPAGTPSLRLAMPNGDLYLCTELPSVCDGSFRGSRVNLNGRNVAGTLPTELGQLSTLVSFELSSNQLSGTVPSQLALLPALELAYVGNNRLSGTVPPRLLSARRLRELDLGFNNISGTCPPQVRIPSVLFLAGQRLSGTLPSEWASQSAMRQMWLFLNQISGTVPAAYAALSTLESLRLYGNRLSGTLPALDRLRRVTDLRLGVGAGLATKRAIKVIEGNRISGFIPSELGALTRARAVAIALQLSGTLPPQLGALGSLTDLNAANQRLSGTIHHTFGALTQLQMLLLQHSNLSGTLPPTLALGRQLWLHRNRLSGTLPPRLGTESSLRELRLSSNAFSGTLPAEWRGLVGVQWLDVGMNQLSGSLPDGWRALSQLRRGYLDRNRLSGTAPVVWGSLASLTTLNMSHNQLSGTLSYTWHSLPATRCDLTGNAWECPLPLAPLACVRNLTCAYLPPHPPVPPPQPPATPPPPAAPPCAPPAAPPPPWGTLAMWLAVAAAACVGLTCGLVCAARRRRTAALSGDHHGTRQGNERLLASTPAVQSPLAMGPSQPMATYLDEIAHEIAHGPTGTSSVQALQALPPNLASQLASTSMQSPPWLASALPRTETPPRPSALPAQRVALDDAFSVGTGTEMSELSEVSEMMSREESEAAEGGLRDLDESMGAIDFELLGFLGSGGSASVYLARRASPPHRLCALKVVRKRGRDTTRALEEVRILRRLGHPYIVKLHYAFEDAESFYLALTYAGGGDLLNRIEKCGAVAEPIARVAFAQVVCALRYLHREGIIFRDLKPENVLIGRDGHLMLVDFGVSKRMLLATDGMPATGERAQTDARELQQTTTHTFIGTPQYMAPEACRPATERADRRMRVCRASPCPTRAASPPDRRRTLERAPRRRTRERAPRRFSRHARRCCVAMDTRSRSTGGQRACCCTR